MTNADFEKIYDKYRGISIRLANSIVKDLDAAEDVCQEAFTSIYNMGDKLDISNEKKLWGLIKTAVYNEAKDFCKRAYRQHEYNAEEWEYEEQISQENYEIEDALNKIQTEENLSFIFQKLRDVNKMNYDIYVGVTFYGIPPGVAAEQYHITPNNVNNRIMRTRRWLYEEYLKYKDGL